MTGIGGMGEGEVVVVERRCLIFRREREGKMICLVLMGWDCLLIGRGREEVKNRKDSPFLLGMMMICGRGMGVGLECAMKEG